MAGLLIVDDELDVREFAVNFFRKRKINAFMAGDGDTAVRLVIEQKPDLVLLDINMPGIDGIETLKRIKHQDKQIKVLMVTGKRPEEDNVYAKCLELGAYGYIHKPLRLDELERIVLKELTDKR